MHILLIPVYNDWKSLNRLLNIINKNQSKNKVSEILIVDDCSNNNFFLDKKKFNKIKSIKILKLKKNVGSQKAIYIGLNYLKKKKFNFFLTVMDSDGEDNPNHIKQMLEIAKKKKNFVVVSCRKNRKENILIKSMYKIHLTICFFLTGNWVSFGNFSTFYSSNLKKLLINNAATKAYSAAILANTKIIKTFSKRSKRFYGKSKVNLLFLINHSFRIIGVFYVRVFLMSLIYFFLSLNFLKDFKIFFNINLIFINFLILLNLLKEVGFKKNLIKEIYKIK